MIRIVSFNIFLFGILFFVLGSPGITYVKHLNTKDLAELGIPSHCSICGDWLPFCTCFKK